MMDYSKEMPNAEQTFYYKVPIPLVIGNLPFGSNFKNTRDEYNYFEYYIIPQQKTRHLGILYYNDFFKNYTAVFKNQNLEKVTRSPINWSKLYPSFYIDGQLYCLNPFVNDMNGACSWIREESGYDPYNLKFNNESLTSPAKVYFNFKNNQYEWGLGEDVRQYDGVTYQLNYSNKCNGFAFHEKIVGQDNPAIYPAVQTTVHQLSTIKNFNPSLEVVNVGLTHKLVSLTTDSFNFDDLTERTNLSTSFYVEPINNDPLLSSKSDYVKYDCRLYKDIPENDDNLYYERLGILPDLDHQYNPDKYEKICGVYENDQSKMFNDAFILGSVVIGPDSNSKQLGNFIGTNLFSHNFESLYPPEYWDTHQRPMYRVDATNVIPVSRKNIFDVDLSYVNQDRYSWSLKDFDFIVVLGYSLPDNFDSTKPYTKKYLVCYLTNFTTGDPGEYSVNYYYLRNNRLYIVDDHPENLLNCRTFWFADLPGLKSTTSIPELFRYPFKHGNTEFEEIRFSYVNLDDEDDFEDSVVFKIIGACRENAYENITGLNISKNSLEHLYSTTTTTYTDSNVYIGHWNTPIVNFKGE